MSDISIIGAGSWGTALSVVLHKNGHKITIWSALAPEIEMLKEKHEQAEKLPGVILPDDIMFTSNRGKRYARLSSAFSIYQKYSKSNEPVRSRGTAYCQRGKGN